MNGQDQDDLNARARQLHAALCRRPLRRAGDEDEEAAFWDIIGRDTLRGPDGRLNTLTVAGREPGGYVLIPPEQQPWHSVPLTRLGYANGGAVFITGIDPVAGRLLCVLRSGSRDRCVTISALGDPALRPTDPLPCGIQITERLTQVELARLLRRLKALEDLLRLTPDQDVPTTLPGDPAGLAAAQLRASQLELAMGITASTPSPAPRSYEEAARCRGMEAAMSLNSTSPIPAPGSYVPRTGTGTGGGGTGTGGGGTGTGGGGGTVGTVRPDPPGPLPRDSAEFRTTNTFITRELNGRFARYNVPLGMRFRNGANTHGMWHAQIDRVVDGLNDTFFWRFGTPQDLIAAGSAVNPYSIRDEFGDVLRAINALQTTVEFSDARLPG